MTRHDDLASIGHPERDQPTPSRIDLDRMRRERTERVLAGMAEEGIDALLLGTGANIRYATGATPLWLAGTRPWAPLAVVLRDGETHLVAGSDDGIPAGHGLLRPSWNPATIAERVMAVVNGAGKVGVDGLTPMFAGLLARELVDATPLMHRARATKTEDELACMRQATSICEQAVADADSPEAFLKRMASTGTTIPAFAPRVDATGFDVGAMVHGYEGGFARTWSSSDDDQEAMARLLDACRPGARPEDLPGAYGIGLGVEPLATEAGSTLCLQAGGRRDIVVIRGDGPEVLIDDR